MLKTMHARRIVTLISTCSAASLLTIASVSAHAQAFPKVKSGLWESVTTSDGQPNTSFKTQICMNDEVMAESMKMGQAMAQGMCSTFKMETRGNTIIGGAECKFGQSKMRSNSVTTVKSDTAYRTETKATFDPPLMGKKESVTVADAKYVGPCGANMKPGDVMMNGRKMNVLEMTKGMQKK
jgi:hypothetical protein